MMKPPFKFFQDINGDWCPKALCGVFLLANAILFEWIAFIIGIFRVVPAENMVAEFVIINLVSSLGMFGWNTLQRYRGVVFNSNENKGANNDS